VKGEERMRKRKGRGRVKGNLLMKFRNERMLDL